MLSFLKDRPSKLFLFFSAFFVANALIAECVGGKIFSLEKLLGLAPANLTILGHSGLSFNLTCGVVLWPLEFIMTDIINEFYGPKAVKRISYTTIALIGYAFLMFFVAMKLPAADFWLGTNVDKGVPNNQNAFAAIFGQGLWIILGSLVAFLFSQLVDVFVFHKIKKVTGDRKIWLRATGSTLVSQLIDSYIVLIIAFKIGNDWPWTQVIAIGIVNYFYKAIVALVLTPVIMLVEKRIVRYLGKATADKMRKAAMGENGITDTEPIPMG
ncbi:MAG: queuosine precursor transporter [Chitinophagaceae bacterium]